MRGWGGLVGIMLVGCFYQPMRFMLRVTDLMDGTTLKADHSLHRAEIRSDEATASLRPESVEWAFGGAFEAGPEPGSFKVKGPGEGTITATFMAGKRQTLTAKLRALGQVVPVALVPTPAPTPTPDPDPIPTPIADPDAESQILEGYRMAAAGDHFGAVSLVSTITDPDWTPKARALISEWSELAIDQGLLRARSMLAAGNRDLARQALDVVSKLSRKPSQRAAERTLRLQLGDRP